MENPESGPRETTAQEQAQRFSDLVDSLGRARDKFLSAHYDGAEMTEAEKQTLFQEFESRQAEEIIARLKLSDLGWFATPDTVDDSASDLDASGDLLIDTEHKIILRAELTASNDIISDQDEIRWVYHLNPFYKLVMDRQVVKETVEQRGEPSIDEDLADVISNFDAEQVVRPSNQIRKEILDSDHKEYSAGEAKVVNDALSRLLGEITKLYDDPNLMINPDINRSTDDEVKYVIERPI